MTAVDVATLDRVKALSPEAELVVRWALRMEGALHTIAEHPEVHGDSVEWIKRFAEETIFAELERVNKE